MLTWRVWRSLDALSNRWLVFVPAGVVLHDALVLAEPTLFARGNVVSFGPAPAATDALDLSANALGLALQLDLAPPQSLAIIEGPARRRTAESRPIARLMIAPSRPGAVTIEASTRHLTT